MRRSLELLLYKVKAMLIEVRAILSLSLSACTRVVRWCVCVCGCVFLPPHLPSPVHARSSIGGNAQNDSLGAFSLGNLKHRDLAGEEVPSQLELDQYDDDDDDDEEGEGEDVEKEAAAEDDESATATTTSDNSGDEEDEMDL
jgi:hypothetical protein